MRTPRFLSAVLVLAAAALPAAEPPPLAELLRERLACVVAVEFTVQTETDRRPAIAAGVVVDEAGLILLPSAQILPGLAPDQVREFKVHRPGSEDSVPAAYLGQDALTGFHFVRLTDAAAAAGLVPVTRFEPAPAPALGDELWGPGLRGKDEDFVPYLLSSRVAMVARLPNATALMAQDVATPGLPVFDRAGRLAGLALSPFGQNFLLFSRSQSGSPIVLVNPEESSVVLLAPEFLPHLARVPRDPAGRPVAWFGAYGVQPVDPDVARVLGLGGRGAVVLSDILPGSPAAQAGLRDRDIVTAVDGQPLPRLKPDRVVAGFFGQEVLRRAPGQAMRLEVRRGGETLEVAVTLGDEPKMVREAERRYFERLGFTAREFLVADAIQHRAAAPAGFGAGAGAVAHFVKPNGPAAAAGLRPDDWIREIDGAPVEDFAAAVARLAAIEADGARAEFVLLTSRGGETQVLRIKLN